MKSTNGFRLRMKLWKKRLLFSTAVSVGVLSSSQAFADFSCANVTEIPQSECEALVELYDSTGGDNWRYVPNSSVGKVWNWKVTNTPCSWYGVTCGNGEVTKILMRFNGLVGSVPDIKLTGLTYLYLDSNQPVVTIYL